MCQGLQTIKDSKRKPDDVADVSLPDKLNTFFTRFEENNIEPPTQSPATHEDCVLSFSVADVSVI
jgi:hypothetical protein